MDFSDKVAIVTGASAGIGLAISKELGGCGAKVVMVARSADLLDKVSRDIPGSVVVASDLRKKEDIERIIPFVINKFGRVDILVNCAGQAMFSKVENIDLDEYRRLIELNVYAPLTLMQQVIPHMRKQKGGTIINISSQSTKKYIPNIAGYASTKYALNAISLTARAELEKDNIKVSIIRPGLVNTDFGKHTKYSEPDTLRHGADGSIFPYVIQPEMVAKKVLELAQSGDAELDM